MAFDFDKYDDFNTTDNHAHPWADKSAPAGVQYTFTPLASLPTGIDVNTFKAHAKIDYTEEDTLLALYLKAAVNWAEKYMQKSLGVRTVSVSAIYLPAKSRLLYGPVDGITTTGYTNTGDLLNEDIRNAEIQYTTKADLATDPTIQVAIYRYATGLYLEREDRVETKYASDQEKSEAKKMLSRYKTLVI